MPVMRKIAVISGVITFLTAAAARFGSNDLPNGNNFLARRAVSQ